MLQALFGARRATRTHVPNIDVRELERTLREDEDIMLIDVRSAAEYERDGHIAGSRLLPLHMLDQRAAELPRDRKIICICRSGNRSQVACEQLARMGFQDVVNVGSGMLGWKRAGLPYR